MCIILIGELRMERILADTKHVYCVSGREGRVTHPAALSETEVISGYSGGDSCEELSTAGIEVITSI
jgi:hypothetical protein